MRLYSLGVLHTTCNTPFYCTKFSLMTHFFHHSLLLGNHGIMGPMQIERARMCLFLG